MSRFFGVIGDVHGEFDALARVIASRPDVAFWLSVGDIASDDMRYPEPVAPFYWIQGNNEDFEAIARLESGGAGAGNLYFLANGTVSRVLGVTVAALGGTFAPTWYETPASELPHRPRDDKRRHFVREQVEALKAQSGIDVLLTHEAPRPYFVQAGARPSTVARGALSKVEGRRIDAGKTVINEVLTALKPRVHFFGHHHRFSEAVRQGVASIGLAMVSESFVVVDASTWQWQKVDTE